MATSQDVIAFRLQYSEFKALTDPDVSFALDDADFWLDAQMWSPHDYPMARYLLAAHFLALLAQLLAQQEQLGGLMGFSGQSLKMVSFGERRVAFGQPMVEKDKSKYASGPDIQLAETWYGQMFLRLRSRNIMPIMTV